MEVTEEDLAESRTVSQRERIEGAVAAANAAHKERFAAAAAQAGGVLRVAQDVQRALVNQHASEVRAAYGLDNNARPFAVREVDASGHLIPRQPAFKVGTDTHCAHGHAKFEPMEDGEPAWKVCDAQDGKKPKEYCRLCKREGRERRKGGGAVQADREKAA